MKALFLTNEFPPHVYGGAGVHVEYLSRELARTIEVEVRCFGEQDGKPATGENLTVRGFGHGDLGGAPKNLRSIFGAAERCLGFARDDVSADVVHCHTWYTHLAGIFIKLNYNLPLIVTVHSLEPLRPWKREQLGDGYDFSCWVEKTCLEIADAVICVSKETQRDVLRLFNVGEEKTHLIHNGIDLSQYARRSSHSLLDGFGIDLAKPYVLFVGRITRQKGIIHLVHAIQHLTPGVQVVLCAGAPDTPEIAAEMEKAVKEAQAIRNGIIWIREMVTKETAIQLYSHAAVFCCPSIYEPFGIINLEAMACEAPVVASAVGGIPEVVVEGETGLLVALEQMSESPFEAKDPVKYARDLATALNQVLAHPDAAREMGRAGRRRAEAHFSWKAIAAKTEALYAELSSGDT